MSAGLASTVAAAVTSRFGVAGTILGAGITAMLVTGGAAVLRSYLESATGKMREMPSRFKGRSGEQKMARFGKGTNRSSFFERFRHALGWFARLPALNRSSVLKRGLWGALAALIIGLIFITVTEFVIGNSLSCGFWGKCRVGAAPGIHLTGADRAANGAGPSVTFGQPKANNVAPGTVQEPVPDAGSEQQGPSIFGGGGGEEPDASTASPEPNPSTASPEPDASTASPEAAPQESPSTASPRAAPQGSPSTASPQAAPSE